MVAKSASPKSTPDANADLQSLKFEAAFSELEAIVRNMEGQSNGPQDLENAIAAYQRGMALLQHCQGQLKVAEEQIRVLSSASTEANP